MVRFSVTYALMIKGIGFGALMVSALKIAVECDTVGKKMDSSKIISWHCQWIAQVACSGLVW